VIAVLRWFSRGCPLLLAAALSFGSPVGAADLMEDVDYRVIPRQKLTDSERIEVVYFFYYGCQWCYQFEPLVEDWLKKKSTDVTFRGMTVGVRTTIKARRPHPSPCHTAHLTANYQLTA